MEGNKKGLFYYINFMLLIMLVLISLLLFFTSNSDSSDKIACLIGCLIYVLGLFRLKYKGYELFGCIGVVLLYFFLTEYGLCILNCIIGVDNLSFSKSILKFLTYDTYVPAIYLTNVAFGLVIIFSTLKDKKQFNFELEKNEIEIRKQKIIYFLGMTFLIFSFLFMTYLFISGRISFSMDYSKYRDTVLQSTIYQYLIIFYAFGICFVSAVANKKQLIFGFIVFFLTAIIFFMTGNRGEVLYPALASFGILNIRNYKIKKKYVIIGIIFLVLIIPFIFSARHGGGWKAMVQNYTFSLGDSLVSTLSEIGVQIRLTVYMLAEFVKGARVSIHGYSYYAFILRWLNEFFGVENIVPAGYNFKVVYATMGFNQVAESYANGGVIGVLLFHMLFGLIIGKGENKLVSLSRLAFYGACCSVFINMLRNKFSSVPTYLLFILVIYIVVILLSRRGKGNKL